jgi:multimeric flavodoxin WrbA
MHVIAFNGSPRKKGNTSTIIHTILEEAASTGAETTDVHLHSLNMKGCQGCLSCKTKLGVCAQKDDLFPHLEAIKSCDAIIYGTPIYMFRITGQMKLFVDRMYCFAAPRTDGGRGYDSQIPAGKKFATIFSQGAEDPDQYGRSIRYLVGMVGTGFGIEEAGRIIHTGANMGPAEENEALLEQARALGRKLAGK